MVTILVAEDDPNLRLLIEARLKPHYRVIAAEDGLKALEIAEREAVDLLVSDVKMPGLDGFALLKKIRDRGIGMPVLLLTALQALSDKKEGFRSGADDYLTKPVDLEELLLRVEALLRRANISASKRIAVGDTIIDSERYAVIRGGYETELPRREFDLLFKLLSYPGRIFTKSELLDSVWGNSFESGEETVKTHMSRLRSRLEGNADFDLVTVKGLGYKAVIPGGQS